MIIVTGAAGFIGSALIHSLNQRGISQILAVDILGKDQRWKNLRALQYMDYMEAADFLEMVVQERIDWSVDAIFHLGACSDTTEPDCTYLVKNNYEYSKVLAGWAVQNDTRFIYASSAATYGDGEKGFKDDESQLESLRPLNMYGYSKQMIDLWACRSGLIDQIVGLKYFNVYGPNEYHKANMRSFVTKAYEQIRDTGKVRLFKSHRPDYADGEQLRDFLYVKDAVEMTLFFYDNPEIAGIYNIGTGTARSWNDLAKSVFSAMNKTPQIEYIPMPESLQDKYQYYTQADISKIRQAGYEKPMTTLEEAAKDYVTNYLEPGKHLGDE